MRFDLKEPVRFVMMPQLPVQRGNSSPFPCKQRAAALCRCTDDNIHLVGIIFSFLPHREIVMEILLVLTECCMERSFTRSSRLKASNKTLQLLSGFQYLKLSIQFQKQVIWTLCIWPLRILLERKAPVSDETESRNAPRRVLSRSFYLLWRRSFPRGSNRT